MLESSAEINQRRIKETTSVNVFVHLSQYSGSHSALRLTARSRAGVFAFFRKHSLQIHNVPSVGKPTIACPGNLTIVAEPSWCTYVGFLCRDRRSDFPRNTGPFLAWNGCRTKIVYPLKSSNGTVLHEILWKSRPSQYSHGMVHDKTLLVQTLPSDDTKPLNAPGSDFPANSEVFTCRSSLRRPRKTTDHLLRLKPSERTCLATNRVTKCSGRPRASSSQR